MVRSTEDLEHPLDQAASSTLRSQPPKDIYSKLTFGKDIDTMHEICFNERRQNYQADYCFNLCCLFYYSIELLLGILLLCTEYDRYNQQEAEYNKGIVIYNFFYILLVIVRLRYDRMIKKLPNELSALRQQYAQDNSTSLITEPPQESYESVRYSTVSKYYVTYMIIFIVSKLYTIAFLVGFGIIFLDYCLKDPESNSIYLKLYLMFYGYTRRILLGLGMMLGIYIYCNRRGAVQAVQSRISLWRPASSASIEKIEVKEYEEHMGGNTECSICLLEFVEKDKVMVLKCDSRHIFHEKCGSQWLQTSGVCPMCRVRVQE